MLKHLFILVFTVIPAVLSAKLPVWFDPQFHARYGISIDTSFMVSPAEFPFPGGINLTGYALLSEAIESTFWEIYAKIGIYGAEWAAWSDFPGDFTWCGGADFSAQWVRFSFGSIDSALAGSMPLFGGLYSFRTAVSMRISPWMNLLMDVKAAFNSRDISIPEYWLRDTFTAGLEAGWSFKWHQYVLISLEALYRADIRFIFGLPDNNLPVVFDQCLSLYGGFDLYISTYNEILAGISAALVIPSGYTVTAEDTLPQDFCERLPFPMRYSQLDQSMFGRFGISIGNKNSLFCLLDIGVLSSRTPGDTGGVFQTYTDMGLNAQMKIPGVKFASRVGLMLSPVFSVGLSLSVSLYFN